MLRAFPLRSGDPGGGVWSADVQAEIGCSIAAPDPVHVVHGPGAQSCPGARFQSQIPP